ncbi:hypothetical protein PDJAM_G00112540 [Pangasius djambal]|uniref:Uncharacterized protein n=1 Tax=Pangasius djambal TaxID=1691987 RepID=A0ACC5Y3H5_9TELE|nr:hypothetical protein [Pangasius djambal]
MQQRHPVFSFPVQKCYNGLGTRLPCAKWQCSGLQRKTRSGNTCSATAICTGSIYQNGVPRGNHPQHCCI